MRWMAVKRQLARFMPTYRLDSQKPFNVEQVQNLLQEYVPGELENHVYNPTESVALAKKMSSELRERIKEELYERYRIIVLVTIGEHKMQSYGNVMQFIWDSERDNYCTISWDNMRTFATVTVLGIYQD